MKNSEKLSLTEDNFIFTKAINIDNLPEKAQFKQRQQTLDAVLNDDKYVAENYYKGYSDNESILHERDGLISRMKQFDYKVHKLIKKNDEQPTIEFDHPKKAN